MAQSQRCTVCRNLVVDNSRTFRVKVEDIKASVNTCQICSLLSEIRDAFSILELEDGTAPKELQINRARSGRGILLILLGAGIQRDSQFICLYYPNPGLRSSWNETIIKYSNCLL